MGDLLKRVAPKVFARDLLANFNDMFGMEKARFKQTEIKRELTSFFGNITIGECKKKLLITSFSLGGGSLTSLPHYQPVVFHNLANDKNSNDLPVVDALLRSSAAPAGYFPIYQGHIDGGIWGNNPTPALIAEVARNSFDEWKLGFLKFRSSLTKKLDSLRVLSFGTGMNIRSITAENESADWGVVPWLRKGHLLELFTGDASTVSLHYFSKSLLGPKYHRIQPILKENIDLHEYQKMELLEKLGKELDISPTLKWLGDYWR
ncbi:MAG: hypothetical protein HQK54_08415, partial [Oligoflexales bacterium]|nr:hypothetical protein [Oligoflexales bacterium]